jgi:SsrA-binding protein
MVGTVLFTFTMKITNRRAFHEYEILDTLEAGMSLTGPEVKSVKGGRMSLEGAFVKIIGREVFLINAQIFPYQNARNEGYDPKRTRKLLLHKKEIQSFITKSHTSRLTIVPLECYNLLGFVKLKIALARGKREYEKREKIKKRDTERDIQRVLKSKI